MALSIKNTHAEALAHELVKISKETLTQAITVALQERLERLRHAGDSAAILSALREISERCGAAVDSDQRTAEEILGYDDIGLFSRLGR
jgi:antitoxin VapB